MIIAQTPCLGSDLYDFPLYLDLSWIPLQDLTPDPPDIPQVVLVVKNLPANAGDIRDTGSIPGSEDSPGGGHGNPLQHSCLENPVDRGA